MSRKILGLDLGTNSIGWALVEQEFEIQNDKTRDLKQGSIIDIGSRIIPMSQDVLSNFDKGVSISQTAERTQFRGARRLRERHLLRRERLHRVLNIIGFLPTHYKMQIDFEKRLGQFMPNSEPKLAYDSQNKFIFKKSFEEMLTEFDHHSPSLLINKKGSDALIPYDWTIYYLRKKALTQKIEKEELAWLLLNFNQKRGYFQLRGEDEEEVNSKSIEFHSLKVDEVTADEKQKGKDEIWYNIILENGWVYRRSSKVPLFEWKDQIKDFIVTTKINPDGSIKLNKEGKENRSISAPTGDEWILLKKKTEKDISNSQKTVGQYIYDTLLQNPKQKINGKLIRVIERQFYKEELKKILQKQEEYHFELSDKNLYQLSLEELYENNESHRRNITNRTFSYLFIDDIIYFQRPLKSKKSLISDCAFENKIFRLNGQTKIEPFKCIAKSHPLFQEFRIWKWMQDLRIFNREKDSEETHVFLSSEDDKVKFFEFLNNRKEIDQKTLLKYFKVKDTEYRWNYVEDKTYPCNETRSQILIRLAKCENISINFLSKEKEEALWHILYSVNDKMELSKALESFAMKNKLGLDFVDQFKKIPPFKSEYGSYSAKAIKKLLSLMRVGKFWNEKLIDPQTKERIEKIINGEYDKNIGERVREKSMNLNEVQQFKGIPEWLAKYIVYDRHSETGDLTIWRNSKDLENFLNPKMEGSFKQHSLRNPIVEQIITETLRVVKDIWEKYGHGAENYFDEIHIELGREMKNPADKRKKITTINSENENTNSRIKFLLAEMINDKLVENVRPNSPSQQEILKIYEEGVLNSFLDVPDDILKISKVAQPSRNELIRYKLWLEQKYRSPYSGEIIPLNKLFTSLYQIEHIIPQSRYFDDSFSNKVICEFEINQDKGNQTALEYIQNKKGSKIELSNRKFVTLFNEEQYEDFVKTNYSKNYTKLKKLQMLDVPEKMIERQMNDTRYISKEVKNLLSKIVRSEKNDEGTTSKYVLSTNGQATSILKNDWGLNDIWNEIITPRFERLNALNGNDDKFGAINEKTNKFLPTVPLDKQKGFNKKRIDHRHHALDALVIACITRNHINYLNNQNALEKGKTKEQKQKSREDLKYMLCDKKYNEGSEHNYKWVFKKPWDNFTKDAKDFLETTIISFKKNLRVINKTVNKYQKWGVRNGKLTKVFATQTLGDSWAIRKPLHVPMPYSKKGYKFDILTLHENIGKRALIIDFTIKEKINEIFAQCGNKVTATQNFLKTNPIKDNEDKQIIFAAFKIETEKFRKRQSICELANRGQGGIKTIEDALKYIYKIADLKIQKDLINHLGENDNDLEKAFSLEGLDNFNKKRKIPINKLPISESGDKRFPLGNSIGTNHKWMEAEKGTNLFFAIYQSNQKRAYVSVPLNEVIEIQKQNSKLNNKLISVPLKYIDEKSKNEYPLLFQLSPNDLVFVPTQDEIKNQDLVNFEKLTKEQVNRIYKTVSFSGISCFFVRNDIAYSIVNKLEFSSLNKMEKSVDKYGVMIKEYCWKLEIDRLGNIIKIIR